MINLTLLIFLSTFPHPQASQASVTEPLTADMLKRQRPSSSQPPASPSVPQNTLAEDIIDIRDLKRRRVAPPSLDGQTRGWHPLSSNAAEDEDEEDYTETDGQCGKNEAQGAQLLNVEYAAVNSVLKEIHILHKHRQLFSPLSPAQITHDSTPHSLIDEARTTYLLPEVRTSSEEFIRVYEHYEDSNKLVLPPLFLFFIPFYTLSTGLLPQPFFPGGNTVLHRHN